MKFYVTFVLQLIIKAVRSLQEDLQKDPGSWAHIIIFTLMRQLVWPLIYFHINYPPTLVGLFSVPVDRKLSRRGFGGVD